MIQAREFLSTCKDNGFTVFSGTPCSYLKPLINSTINESEFTYYAASNEGDAVALVSGAYLTGNRGVAMFQNSGFGNAVNALTSLTWPFRIPCLLIITHRGEPGGAADEPQHEQMGEITTGLLDLLKIGWSPFPQDGSGIEPLFEKINNYMDTERRPYALVMSKGAVADSELKYCADELPIGERSLVFNENLTLPYSQRSSRTDALKVLLKHKQKNDVVVATTGMTGRELYTLEDTSNHFYMVGSMGSAPSFSLGIALCASHKRVTVVDGDGALLMRMGNLASIGLHRPKNMVHLVLDNETHDSTGGQESGSRSVMFAAIAKSCGYGLVYSTDSLAELDEILSEKNIAGPVLIHFRTHKGSPASLGRPKVRPYEVCERIRQEFSVEQ